MLNFDWRKRRAASVLVPLTVLSLLAAVPMSVNAVAAGGTAKPPTKGAIAPFVTATLPDPVTSVDPALIHGFADTGFIQAATVDTTNANCPNTPADQPSRFGGTLTLNHGPIVIPCNMVIQLPANTMTWADFIHNWPSRNGLGRIITLLDIHRSIRPLLWAPATRPLRCRRSATSLAPGASRVCCTPHSWPPTTALV